MSLFSKELIIHVNKAMVHDLEWFVSHIEQSDGVYFFEDVDWDFSLRIPMKDFNVLYLTVPLETQFSFLKHHLSCL